MRTNDQMVIDKLTEELTKELEMYRLAFESNQTFEVRKKIRIKIKEISGQIKFLTDGNQNISSNDFS